ASQPGGDLLAAANPLGFVRGINLADGRVRFEFQAHESSIRRVVFLPGGERFLTAATLPDGRQALQCWDARNGRACESWNGGSGEVRQLSVHPISGELIVLGRAARVWEAGGLAPIKIIRGDNPHPSAVFWGDDTLFAPASDSQGAALQYLFGQNLSLLWTNEDGAYGQPSVSADGRRAAIARYNSGQPLLVLERNGPEVRQLASVKPAKPIDYVRISPTGDRVAVSQNGFRDLYVFTVATGKQSTALDLREIWRVSDLAWLDGGNRLVGLVTTHAP